MHGLPGTYSTQIQWGIHTIDARPVKGKGFWGKRIPQKDARVEAFELKINPNNESFYVPHPNGGYVQFENLVLSSLQDGKLIQKIKGSIYHVYERPEFLRKPILDEATRQIQAATSKGLSVEWLVSEQKAVIQLTRFFQDNNIDITVKFMAE